MRTFTISYTGKTEKDIDIVIGAYIDEYGKGFKGHLMKDCGDLIKTRDFTAKQVDFFGLNKMFACEEAMETYLDVVTHHTEVQLEVISKVYDQRIDERRFKKLWTM